MPLPRAERDDLDAVTFTPLGGSRADDVGASRWPPTSPTASSCCTAAASSTSATSACSTPHTQHIAFSVTKSFVATIAATLVHEGVLDERATVADYVPELRDERLRRRDASGSCST